MTDTKILDYLQDSYTLCKRLPNDVRIGSVVFILGLKPGTLRELLSEAIHRDQQQRVAQIATLLKS